MADPAPIPPVSTPPPPPPPPAPTPISTPQQPPASTTITTTHSETRTLQIGTRSSALALAQVDLFTNLLKTSPSPTISALPTSTHPTSTSLGDTNKTTALHTLANTSGKSLWTEDLEEQLLQGEVDVIVHSLKDVPTKLPVGCVVQAVGGREEGRDCVVLSSHTSSSHSTSSDGVVRRGGGGGKGLGDLKEGAVIGTSSIRRAAMIRRSHPHLKIKDIRGNVPTRIRKLDTPAEGYDALVLAGAGVQRLGMAGRIASWLGKEEGVLHAVGQGAIGVEWREDDAWVRALLEAVGKGRGMRRVRWECVAERAMLRVLEGGCSVPVGVDCSWEDDGEEGDAAGGGQGEDGGILRMQAMVVSVDGKQCVEGSRRQRVSGDTEAEECGWMMARELVDKGAGEILKAITLNRGMIKDQDGA